MGRFTWRAPDKAEGTATPLVASVSYIRVHRPILLGFKIALGMFLFSVLLLAVLLALPIGALGLFGMALKALLFSSRWYGASS